MVDGNAVNDKELLEKEREFLLRKFLNFLDERGIEWERHWIQTEEEFTDKIVSFKTKKGRFACFPVTGKYLRIGRIRGDDLVGIRLMSLSDAKDFVKELLS